MLIKSHIKNPRKIHETKSFIKVEAIKLEKDPKAAFKAWGPFVILKTTSPINAPVKGPVKNPNGMGDSSPIINPNTAPIAPALILQIFCCLWMASYYLVKIYRWQ